MSAATRNPSAPHITLPEGLPGIRGPMAFRPETAKPLNELVDVLLRGPHTLTQAERELIATYVSAQNECRYCQTIHAVPASLRAIAASERFDSSRSTRTVDPRLIPRRTFTIVLVQS